MALRCPAAPRLLRARLGRLHLASITVFGLPTASTREHGGQESGCAATMTTPSRSPTTMSPYSRLRRDYDRRPNVPWPAATQESSSRRACRDRQATGRARRGRAPCRRFTIATAPAIARHAGEVVRRCLGPVAGEAVRATTCVAVAPCASRAEVSILSRRARSRRSPPGRRIRAGGIDRLIL